MRTRLSLLVASCLALLPGMGFTAIAAGSTAVDVPPARVSIPADAPADGRYATAQGEVYIGHTAEPPSKPQLEYFDTATQRIGNLVKLQDGHYRSEEQPYLDFDLGRADAGVIEERHEIDDTQGHFGFSLWHAPGMQPRALIVLLQGADDSTREMGFLIPYFVANGVSVLTYDQRGTGLSSGDWHATGPVDKAADVVAALQSLAGNPLVDSARVGVWGPSNGGWVAPIVAHRYPLAFMMLKSASSGTIVDNVLYEIRQDLLYKGRFTAQQADAAMRFEHVVFQALQSNDGWAQAGQAMKQAQVQPWYPLMRIPPGITTPPAPPMLAALRASLIYDPRTTLEQVKTPTLALFGKLDRNVDAVTDERGFRAAFAKSGLRDFSVRVFPAADHLLMASTTGYEQDALTPARFVPGYPSIMLDWLRQRGLTGDQVITAQSGHTRSGKP